jgi:hypothetical protein
LLLFSPYHLREALARLGVLPSLPSLQTLCGEVTVHQMACHFALLCIAELSRVRQGEPEVTAVGVSSQRPSGTVVCAQRDQLAFALNSIGLRPW